MKILLTGGAGFIGTSVINKLLEDDNNEIFIFDNFERNSLTEKVKKKIKIYNINVLCYQDIEYRINLIEPDIMIHLAALCGVDNVLNRPSQTMEVNAIGTYNILKAISYNENIFLKKFINFSTSEVYGSYSFKLGEDEKTSMGVVGEARWTYSISKLFSEHLCFSYSKQFDIPAISIRPFNIYGPGQVGEGAIHVFLKKCLNNEDIQIYGDGSQIRSWCYIDDAVDFIFRCINDNEIKNEVFNMGNPEGTITTIGLAKKIIEITKSKSKINFVDLPYVDVDLRIPNIEKAKKLLNFEPKIGLDDGILRTYKWYKNQIKR